MKQTIQQWVEHSIFVNVIKSAYRRYMTFENRMDEIYSYSLFYRILSKTWDWICIVFRYSIFGRLTEIGEGEPIPVFETSRVANKILEIYSRFVKRITEYSRESVFVISGFDIGESFQQKPLKTGGVILVTAIPVNIFLIFITGSDVSYLGMGMRIVLFLLGLAGLYSDIGLETLKEGSVFIKRIEQKT
ncbi:MAG: hypothetical protein HY096_04255 [Nitrospinae bacterium]|nr:hypothetical protein [Nitrospinota bacterium]